MRLRLASTVGDDHTLAPAGPHNWTPAEFLWVCFSSAVIVLPRQSSLPLAASRAATLPRNLQHSYWPLAPKTSSGEEAGTYSLPSQSVGAPVVIALSYSLTRVFHSTLPVSASSAYALACWSAKYTAHRFPSGATVIAVRTGNSASNVQ